MLERYKSMLNRWRDGKAADALTERDLADLGMSRDQVLNFLRMPQDVPERLVAMGKIFGLTERQLKTDHGTWIERLEVCGACADRSKCARVIGRGTDARPDDAAFCPNASGFASGWQTN